MIKIKQYTLTKNNRTVDYVFSLASKKWHFKFKQNDGERELIHPAGGNVKATLVARQILGGLARTKDLGLDQLCKNQIKNITGF